MAQLYNVDSPINREQRNNLNATFEDILRRFSNLANQIALLSGGQDVEDIINRIEAVINDGNTSNAQVQNLITQVENVLTQVETALLDVSTATQNADNASADARLAITDLQNFVNQLGNGSSYDNNTAYVKNNIVEFNGSSYIALTSTQGNEPPLLPIKNNQYWQLIAQRGVDGSGAVSSVNNLSPDVNGNIQLDVPTLQNFNDLVNTVDNKVDKGSLKVNVKDYGAVGDGATDDTLSIQNAIDFVESQGGGIVFLPEGVYCTSSTINMKHRTSLIGSGHESTRIQSLSDITLIEADSTVNGVIGRLVLSEMQLINQSGSTNDILRLVGVQHFYIDSVTFVFGGIYSRESTHVFMDKIYMYEPYRGLFMDSCVRHFLSNFEITETVSHGIEITKNYPQLADVISISNGEINSVSNGYGVYIHDFGDGFTQWYYVQLSGCLLGGWRIQNSNQNTFVSCYAEGGVLTNTVGSPNGFSLENANYSSFVNCRCTGFSENGFLVTNSSYNRFINCHAWYNVDSGFRVNATTMNCDFNTFDSCLSQLVQQQQRGFHLFGLGSYFVTNTKIVNCTSIGFPSEGDYIIGRSKDTTLNGSTRSDGSKANSWSQVTDGNGQISIVFPPSTRRPLINLMADSSGYGSYAREGFNIDGDGLYTFAVIRVYDRDNTPLTNATVYGTFEAL